jgi:hypothetical protein
LDSECGKILIFKAFLPLKIQINSKKTRFRKEKPVENVVTLGPMAQATLVLRKGHFISPTLDPL